MHYVIPPLFATMVSYNVKKLGYDSFYDLVNGNPRVPNGRQMTPEEIAAWEQARVRERLQKNRDPAWTPDPKGVINAIVPYKKAPNPRPNYNPTTFSRQSGDALKRPVRKSIPWTQMRPVKESIPWTQMRQVQKNTNQNAYPSAMPWTYYPRQSIRYVRRSYTRRPKRVTRRHRRSRNASKKKKISKKYAPKKKTYNGANPRRNENC